MVLRANRAFLRRTVEYCAATGIDQFLDHGSGIPTADNVHEVAQRLRPDARVVYVDNDPVAVAHSRAILAGNPRATITQADMRDPAQVLGDPNLGRFIDLTRPMAVLMVAVLHFVPDSDRPSTVVARFRDALAPGSLFVASHASYEGEPPQGATDMRDVYTRTGTPLIYRSHPEITTLFDGFDLVDPGVVRLLLWQPDHGTHLGTVGQAAGGEFGHLTFPGGQGCGRGPRHESCRGDPVQRAR